MKSAGWRRGLQAVSAVVTGAVVGTALALPLFGYPPAYLAPPGDDRTECGRRVDRTAATVIATLTDAGVERAFSDAWSALQDEAAPAWRLQAARCGSGIEVWGTPLRSEPRSAWLQATEVALQDQAATVVDEHLARRVEELASEQVRLEAELDSATLLLLTTAEAIDPGWIRDDGPPAPLESQLRRQLTDALALVTELEAELAAVRSEQAADRDAEALLGPFAQGTVLVEPPSPTLPLTMGGLLGAAVGLVGAVGWPLLERRRRQQPPSNADGSSKHQNASSSEPRGG